MTVEPVRADLVGPEARDIAQRQRVRESAQAFEAMLLQRLIRSMTEGQGGGFFGGGTGTSVYEGMMEHHLAEHLSHRSPLGLAEVLEQRWLERLRDPGDVEAVQEEMRTMRGLAAYQRDVEGLVDAAGVGIPDTGNPADLPGLLKKPAD